MNLFIGRGKKFIRRAAGQTWEDQTLGEWDPTDYRLFCGDLGNEGSLYTGFQCENDL